MHNPEMLLDLTPTPLKSKHDIEIADGKLIEISHILKGCKLNLSGHTFDIDLMPVPLGSFDAVVGMDWLSRNRAEIIFQEKIIRIPLPSGETISIVSEKSDTVIGIISCMKAQKHLQKGYHAILALVTDKKTEEKKIEDIPIVCDFTDVFPKDLPGLPPHRH
ncbi:uncharacterized protein LOC143533966 [Bidens hawaiensis]|uniref:uncharacterized protein LOC143533966 n=1 Tax=Bidens hawaiensis TaxID=980011 RepID=UPI00404A60E8